MSRFVPELPIARLHPWHLAAAIWLGPVNPSPLPVIWLEPGRALDLKPLPSDFNLAVACRAGCRETDSVGIEP